MISTIFHHVQILYASVAFAAVTVCQGTSKILEIVVGLLVSYLSTTKIYSMHNM